MRNFKKITSIMLTVVMMLSTISIVASAGAPAPTGKARASVHYEVVDADGNLVTQVKSKDVVYVNVYSNSAKANDPLNGFNQAIVYDNSIYELDQTAGIKGIIYKGIKTWVDTTSSSVSENYMVAPDDYSKCPNTAIFENVIAKATTAEKEARPYWDTVAYVMGIKLGEGTDYFVQENADKPMYALKLNVKDGIEELSPSKVDASIGVHPGATFRGMNKSFCNVKTNYTTNMIRAGVIQPPVTQEIKIASGAAQVSPLKRVNTQYKKGENVGGVQQFQLRTTSSISKADMATLLSVDATPENIKANVQNIGFVITDDTTVNPEHVKAAIKAGGQFTTTGGKIYMVGTTNTLVQTDTDYQFRAMVSVEHKLPVDGIKLQSFIDVNGTLTMYADALTLTADKIK